ncbi:MAG: hypothetical protein INQ03_11285 [Candidatus Heimdallarchaeota archaeon]|nr:hypothetical protein [Candidatus Heimdallarchaeota archaeon]
MSSFVLMTKNGVPEVSVEVGKKFSKDTVLLSAMFKAIHSFSTEITDDGIQLLQISGFTIKFMNVFDDEWMLIVGADKNISNLNSLLEKISVVIHDGFQKGVPTSLMENQISTMLTNNLEMTANQDDAVHFLIEEVFSELDNNILQVMLWAMLTGNHIRTPKTRSMDFNKYIITFLDSFGLTPCDGSDLCEDAITFVDKTGEFILNGTEYSAKKNFIQKTKILKDLLKLGNDHKFSEFEIYFQSINSTINRLVRRADKDSFDEKELKDINLSRHLIGMEMEHYFLERLKTVNQKSYDYLRNNTDELEWITEW